jgi:5-formyltetrahydrofolate cyclo-ligase
MVQKIPYGGTLEASYYMSQLSLRRAILSQRRKLPLAQRQLAATKITHYISNTSWFQHSKRIAFYLAKGGEVDPIPLMQCAWEMGKICYLPVCHPLQSEPLWFIRYNPGEPLIENRYGILEPQLNRNKTCKPYTLDLVITPLVGFDQQGNRLGSGKGYYDKTFAYLRRRLHQKKPQLVGLAYSFQEAPQLEPQPWDIPLSRVIAFDFATKKIRSIAPNFVVDKN